jgi:hypothetical protein
MPIVYEIDRTRGLIRTCCVGPVTLGEVMDHFNQLRSDARLPKRVNVLIDVTAMSSAPDRDELRAVVAEVKKTSVSLDWGVLAVVAQSDLLFGMHRIFAVFIEDNFTATGVFRTHAEAERWLDLQLGPN